MVWVIVFGALALLALYSRLVMTGRKAMVFKVLSRASPENCLARMNRFAGGGGAEHRTLEDGSVESVFRFADSQYTLHNVAYDSGLPNADKSWNRIEWAGRSAEYWEVQTARRTSFGSLYTFGVQGRFDFAIYLMMLAGMIASSLMLLLASNRPPRARAPSEAVAAVNTDDTSTSSRSAPKPRAAKHARGKIDNFVGTYGNELMLSALAILSFTVTFGWDGALMLAPIILIHEYGHLLAFRMFGHTGNRMMLVPFMGGIAIPSGGYRSEYEAAVTAIMGPAICIPISVGLTILTFMAGDHWLSWWFAWGAMLSAVMNALNLFPALPLDGGHSFQALARSIAPTQTSAAMLVLTMSCAVLLEYGGYSAFAGIVGIWGGMEVARTWNQPSDLTPLNARLGAQIVVMHIGTFAIHGGCAWLIWSHYYY